MSAGIAGYALRNVRISVLGSEETLRFDAILVHDGQDIGVVSNDGTGGSHRYRALTADGRAAIRAFERVASIWGTEQHPPMQFEPDDALIDTLLEEHIDQWWGTQPIHGV